MDKTINRFIMTPKEIGIIGHIGHFGKLQVQELIAKQAMEKNIDVIVVDTESDNTFEINGITYEPIHDDTKVEKRKFPPELMGIQLCGDYIYEYKNHILPFVGYANQTKNQRKLSENINIIREFELIQIKCSKLSKWERDEVVRIFKLKFKEIK